ncbi:MAG: 4-hydroxy-tetrahydrodipicolinate reductase [Bacteroidales bacterium]|nr:4-hydroxy-tetrahydrodipicolinate reductase [Bacteroidales bacterium]
MKIAIIGYGRMGREIEEMALHQSHEIAAIIDNENDWANKWDALSGANVAIEFSMPETAANNIRRCFEAGLAVVSGTTAWSGSLDEINKLCLEGGHSFFYASNFSPGMNIMFELNKKLAALMGKHPQYRILIEEIHHSGKKDAPSGTAITLANEIIHHHPVKDIWINKPAIKPNELEIISLRKNQVPGTHFVRYDSEIDSLEIKHTAHTRKGFALGALLAAEWLIGKKGCFDMHDMLYDEK